MSESIYKDSDITIKEALEAHKNGDLEKAKVIYKKLLGVDPKSIQSLNNLASIYKNQKNYKKAITLYEEMIALDVKSAQIYNSCGVCYENIGNLNYAIELYKSSIRVDKNFISAYNNLGVVLYKQKQYDKSILIFKMAYEIDPDNLQTLTNLGAAQNRAKEYDNAIEVLQKAISLDANHTGAYVNLGNVYNKVNRHKEALECHKKALALDPHPATNYANIAISYKNLELYKESIENFKYALKIEPEFVNAHFDLSTVLLLNAEYEEGFSEYQWRFKKEEMLSLFKQYPYLNKKPIFNLNLPTKNKTLLIYAEQGFGDNIQFIRYAKLLKERFASLKIKVSCRLELVPLFETLNYIDKVVDREGDIGEFDYEIAVMSLAYLFKTSLETIPFSEGYIDAKKNHIRVKTDIKKLNIALVWGGSNTNENHKNRVLCLEKFSPLINHPEVKLFSMQVGEDSKDIKKYAFEDKIIDLSPKLTNFKKSASALKQVDLLITSDTSVAHLAGAMGVNCWLLLQKVPDWRWLTQRDDSPWYNSIKIFRQSKKGEWDSVYRELFLKLQKKYFLKGFNE